MHVFGTILGLESEIINFGPCSEALLLENLLEVRFTTADTFENLECFLQLNAVLMGEVLELLDESLVLALLVRLLGSGSLVRLAVALPVLLEECLFDRVVLDGDVNLYDLKIKLFV